MECSEPNELTQVTPEREQTIKAYAKYIKNNPSISEKEIHFDLSAQDVNNNHLIVTPDKLKGLGFNIIPPEIIKNIFSKKYSLKHLIDSDNNSNITILFPNGSPLFDNNQPDVFVVLNKSTKYTLTNSIQTRKGFQCSDKKLNKDFFQRSLQYRIIYI